MNKKIIIKFYSAKLLLTVDLNELVRALLIEFGESLNVELAPMTESEKLASCEEVSGIAKVNQRLIILVDSDRRRDLEKSIRST